MSTLPHLLSFTLLALIPTICFAAADRPATVVRQTAPVYPFELHQKKIAGYAVIEFVVELNGRPSELRVLEASHRDFEMSGLACLSRWRFRPAVKNGVRVRARMSVRFDFDPNEQTGASKLVEPTPALTPQSAATDPIDELVAFLSPKIAWHNGLFVPIPLSASAPRKEVLTEKEVRIPPQTGEAYFAAHCRTERGEQIILMRYIEEQEIGWWTRAIDVDDLSNQKEPADSQN